ncbi:kelch repeat and BTB domain-containing protein 4 [Caerostris darwini]|uniref:Kelch repeat and BTB domain-containing protein 4 n=1 Tax=Caerostris darwini TaxID=1538125 RepID=A0AAV4S0N0_9ARAC|nr:kelch repeat and BTB domain-containing protein 4 [Caerostris darwini]
MEKNPNRNEVIMRTDNPVHEGDFKWIIENTSKFSRRLRSCSLKTNTDCKPEFQMVAKFNDRFPDVNVTNVNIGIQRVDSGDESIHVSIDVQLLNQNGDEYCRKQADFRSSANGAPFYLFSEFFSCCPDKLTVPKVQKSISSKDNHELLSLHVKKLVATHGNVDKIFILPNDILIVKTVIKTFGCCVITNKMEVPDVPDKLTLQSHMDRLLNDIRDAYVHQDLTDLELLVDGQSIRVHKFILQCRSPVFRTMFEHNLSEKTDGTVEIQDVDFIVMQALVWYLYTGVVHKLPYEDLCDLYEAADKYEVSSLFRQCSEILKSFIGKDTVCRILVLADLHHDSKLREEAIQFVNCNFAKVKVTEEWQMTMKAHQNIASDVLERVCEFSNKTIPMKPSA